MADRSTALGYIGAGMSDAGASLQGRSQDELSAYAKYVEELKADKEYSAAEREWAKVSNFLMVNQFGSQEEAIAEIQKNPALMKSYETAVAYAQKPYQRSQVFKAQMQDTMTNLAKVQKKRLDVQNTQFSNLQKFGIKTGQDVEVPLGMRAAAERAYREALPQVTGPRYVGGEGLVVRVCGPSRFYFQTRSPGGFVDWLIPKIPQRSS